MDQQKHFCRQFAYDHWANMEVAQHLANLSSPPSRSVRWLAHIVAAERLWLERLETQPQSTAVWPELDLPECRRQVEELRELWRSYLDRLGPDDFSSTISYKNSKGEPWQSAVEDVLTHVVMHSAYHRGQIAADMRSAGLVPAYTDYIHCVRQGWAE